MAALSPIVERLRLLGAAVVALRGADLWRVLACLALGGAAGYLLVPGRGALRGVAGEEATPPVVMLEGRPLPLDGDPAAALDAARSIAREWMGRKLVVAVPGAPPRETTREQLGARVDPARLAAVVSELRDPHSAARRAHALAHRERPVAEPLRFLLPVAIDGAHALSALVALKDDVDRRPVDARLDVGGHKVLPDEPGRRMDVHATLARLDQALLARRADTAPPEQIEAIIENVPAGGPRADRRSAAR